MTRDYEADVEANMQQHCPLCRTLDDPKREAHKRRALEEIYRTQTRVLEPLPEYVWPHGRAPK